MAGKRFLERDTPRSNKHHSYSAADFSDLMARALEWARGATRERETFTLDELREGLSIGSETAQRVVRTLQADGSAVSLGRRGLAATGVLRKRVGVEDLRRIAREAHDPAARAPAGQRRRRESRHVDTITTSQLKDIDVALNFIAAHLADDASVDLAQLSICEETESGATEWLIVRQVNDWAEAKGRSKAATKGRVYIAAKDASRIKLIGATALAFDLAASKGVIERNARHTADYTVHAPELQPWILSATHTILARTERRADRMVRLGCRLLMLYATRSGVIDPTEIDWVVIRDRIEADHQTGTLRDYQLQQARWVYRKLRTYGAISGPQWDMKAAAPVGLVPKKAVVASATSGEFTLWLTLDGRAADGLTQGLLGLKSWRLWSTVPRSDLDTLSLQPRAWVRPTPDEERRIERATKEQKELFRLSSKVVLTRLGLFNLVAGWMARECAVDWTTENATRLCDPALVKKFCEVRANRHLSVDRNGDPADSVASAACFALATLASPYLEAHALALHDDELADRMKTASDKLKVLGLQYAALSKKDIWAIADAWDGGSNQGGWTRLEELRDAIIADVERLGGGRPLVEQIAAIRSGGFVPAQTWAVKVRAACLISLLRVIPVRAFATVELTLGMWQSTGNEPWEGAIQLFIPSQVTKSRRPFRPYLFRPEHIGQAPVETHLRRDLWQLYLMRGGAREEILSIPDAVCVDESGKQGTMKKVCESDYLFPALARRGGGHGSRNADRIARRLRWNEGSLSSHFSKIVLEYASRIGLNIKRLRDLWGATSFHVLRLLFGTYWAGRDLLAASLMLQHRSVLTTQRKYCALDESRVDLFAGNASMSVPDLLKRIAELEARLRDDSRHNPEGL